jgi:polysaccharide deacetylase 2 family uncharacterized protein YibQ
LISLFVLLVFCARNALAENFASIIIDDLGNSLEPGQTIISFPKPVTLSILPRTEYARQLAVLAHNNNREVMLHLPLQSIENHKHSPGTLDLHMTHKEFVEQLNINLKSVPHASGINNHMGSLLTQHPGHMGWLMAEIAKNDQLFFVDSLTSNKSVATDFATKHKVPNMVRDVFLDPDDRPSTIRKQFDQFITIANTRGYAIAIAHPHPATLAFIEQHLDELEDQGIKLVPVSSLIDLWENEHHVTCTGSTCAGL